MWNKNKRMARAIRTSIDSYPGGISFSTRSGLPILVNTQMNRLISILTGHTLLETEATWKALQDGQIQPGCRKCDMQFLGAVNSPQQEHLAFVLPDGSIWHLEKQTLTERKPDTVQITAADVTELCTAGRTLYENNLRLTALHERQKKVLQNMVRINQEKELLRTKVRIHDEFGRCLLMTRMALDQSPEVQAEITENWLKTILDLRNLPAESRTEPTAAEKELVDIANMLSCTLRFTGPRPDTRGTSLLFYAAVREALTNAVRHGHATVLTVSTQEAPDGYQVEIRDNGAGCPCGITPGGGLLGLRRRLEAEGASLQLTCTDGVVLHLYLPKERKELV